MVYQYIFGRDIELGYKTINASTKLKADGERMWQRVLNIEYTPPENVSEVYPESIVYYNIKDATSVVGKIIYQTDQHRNNYMQHYYLLEGEQRDEFLKNSYQFDISHFETDIESAYNSDVESQNVYSHVPFTIEDARNFISEQKIPKRVLELVLFACFEAATRDGRVFFIDDFSNENASQNNLNLLKIVFGILPAQFKEKLGFITYYKYLISPAGKALRSDIKLIFTENSEQNLANKNRVILDGDYLFDFVNGQNAVNTENILYGSLLEFLTEPFYMERSIEDVLIVLNRVISCFTSLEKVKYNLASIAYEILYRKRKLDYRIANILIDNYNILGEELKSLLNDWILSDSMKETVNEQEMHSLLFKAYNYDEFKDRIVEYFAQQMNSKDIKYMDILFCEDTPTKLMESVCTKLLNEDRFLDGGIFLLHNSILNTKDKASSIYHPIEVFDVLKYFSQFSQQYYKYFDEREIYENYFRGSINILDISGFESLSNSFSKFISNANHEATAARLKILHRLILKRYILPRFESLNEFSDLKISIDMCFELFVCAKPEENYFHSDLENSLRSFAALLLTPRNISNFENIDYLFQKAIANYKYINTFLNIFGEIMLKAFAKENLTVDEYNRLLAYSKELDIKLDVSKIPKFDIYKFKSDIKKYMDDKNIEAIVEILEKRGSYLKEDTKKELIHWIKTLYKGKKDSRYFKLLIYLYTDNYSEIFSLIENDENYTQLKLYMKEMKNLSLSSNSEYMKFLANYINDDRKLKKYIKNMTSNQRREIGLNSIADISKQSDFNNPILLFAIIYFLIGIIAFLAIRTIDYLIPVDNLMIPVIANVVLTAIMYALWFFRLSDYDRTNAITQILTAISSFLIVINIAVGILATVKPRNIFVNTYKDLYAVNYDNIAPDLSINSIMVDSGGSTEFISDFEDKISINDGSNITVILNSKDDSDFSVRAQIGNQDIPVENKKFIKIDNLENVNSELVIKAEDTYKNVSDDIKLEIIKEAAIAENTLDAVFSSSVYNSEGASADYPSMNNEFKLSVPEGGHAEINFEIKASNKYKYEAQAMLNDIEIPFQTVTFNDSGFKGRFYFNYDNLNESNTLNIKIQNSKDTKEYKFYIDRIVE